MRCVMIKVAFKLIVRLQKSRDQSRGAGGGDPAGISSEVAATEQGVAGS
jgi:hypothetical protein